MFSFRYLLLGSSLVLWSCFGEVAVDEVPPETTISSAPPSIDNHATPTFEFSADEDDATFHCTIDGVAAGCSSPYMVALTDGAHTFTVFAVDRAGNQDTSPAVHAWTIDTVAPDTTITEAPPSLDNGASASFAFRASEQPAMFECSLDGGPFAPCTSPKTVHLDIIGEHRFSVRAVDAAGNIDESPARHVWELDTSTPDTVIDAAPAGAVASQSATITFSSPNAGSGASYECRLDGGTFSPCTSPQSLSNLAEGAHTFEVRARNGAGTYDPTPATRTWTVDTIAPVVTFTAGPLENATSGPRVTFTYSANEAVSFTCAVDQGPHQGCTGTSSFNVGAGARAFHVRATDAAGNVATIVRHWTVVCTPFPGGAGGRGLVRFEEVLLDSYGNPRGYFDSINGRELEYLVAPSTASGRFGKGIQLTGTTRRWDGLVGSVGDHSLAMWVRVTMVPSLETELWDGGYIKLSYEGFDAGARFVYELRAGSAVQRLSSPAVSLGEWHHVVATNANGAMTIWIDGVPSTGVTAPAQLFSITNPRVGGVAGTDLDEIYVASQAMSEEVVLANYCPAS